MRTITPLEIRNLVGSWIREGKRDRQGGPTGEPLGAHAVANAYTLLCSVFREAVENDVIPKSPCRLKKRDLPATEVRDVPEMAIADIAALADAVEERFAPMVWIAGILGLRIGEVLALRVSDVNFLRRTLSVSRAITTPQGRPVEGPPKSLKSKRSFRVPEALLDLLAAHCSLFGLKGGDLLFPSSTGGLLRPEHWDNRVWAKARVECGFPELHFHDLRHVAATFMTAAGVDPKTFQNRMGHASAMTGLDRYASPTNAGDEQAAAALQDLMEKFIAGA
jgi:integrase